MAKNLTPVEKLMQYMDACARMRGEAMWTQGYRARFEADMTRAELGTAYATEAKRLYEKEQAQFKYYGVVEARFRRFAQYLLRKARKQKAVRTVRRRHSKGDKK